MPHRDASRTALGTAYLRAAHQLLDPPPRILEDPVALPLLGSQGEQRVRDAEEDHQTPERRALRARVALRSRFAEDRLAAATSRGVVQYVVLGAGFDTFALRQPAWARSLAILEVDHAATQAMKRAMIDAAGLAVPGNVRFATVDFERESLLEGLSRHIRPDVPTFFSWLGVTMYLERDAVEAVLRSVAQFPAGSEIVVTFASAEHDASSELARHVEALGEPWTSYFEPDEIAALLRATGFRSVELLTPADARARYFRAGTSDLPPPTRTSIACAVR